MSSTSSSPPPASEQFQYTTRPGPWRPWSIPIDLVRMRRKLCALLNKLTPTNFDTISDEVVTWALRIERSDDPTALNTLVDIIFQRGVLDSVRIEVYAKLCQKIIDELEGERTRWKKVDVYYMGNPFLSFEMAIQILVQREFDRVALQRSMKELRAMSSFVGELLVHGVLSSDDVGSILELLFVEVTKNSEDHTGTLCCLLTRILRATDASQILEALEVIERVERILQENQLSSKVRFMMMNILEQAVYPKPFDTFASAGQRTEIYGLDMDDDEENDSSLEKMKTNPQPFRAENIRQHCRESAHTFIITRNLVRAEAFFNELAAEDRHHLVAAMVSTALETNDSSDAALVGRLFSANTIRKICHASFMPGFETVVMMLEDTTLDIPSAYRLVAQMLHACALDRETVEDLASRIIIRENRARDHFMEEFIAFDDSLAVLEASTSVYDDASESSEDGEQGRFQSLESDAGIRSDSNAYASGSEFAYAF